MAKVLIGNIKGPQGPQGEQGIQGPRGEQGIQGPQGEPGKVIDTITICTSQLEPLTAGTGVEGFDFRGVTYANGKFVAVGNNCICKSDDGSQWESDLKSWETVDGTLYDVAYNDSLGSYLAVGNGVAYAYFGTWVKQSGTFASASLNRIICVDGKFVAVGNDCIYYAANSVSLKAASNITGTLNDVIYADGKFVAVGNDCGYYSKDGITWTPCSGIDSNLSSVTYGDGKFVATVSGMVVVYTSEDGITWTENTASTNYCFSDKIHYINGTFISCGEDSVMGTPALIVSKDGITWNKFSTTSKHMVDMTYGNDKVVFVGDEISYYTEFAKEQHSIEELLNELYKLL